MPAEAVDLVSRLLQYSPNLRCTAQGRRLPSQPHVTLTLQQHCIYQMHTSSASSAQAVCHEWRHWLQWAKRSRLLTLCLVSGRSECLWCQWCQLFQWFSGGSGSSDMGATSAVA